MSVLAEYVGSCLSLAFASLHQEEEGWVNKSKLKVLTANIGTLLDLHGVEKGLDHFTSAPCLNFYQFEEYLQKHVFVSVPDTITLNELRTCENRIAEVCWLICHKKYMIPGRRFVNDSACKLFRVFCMLAELSPNGDNRPQVLLAAMEAEIIAEKLATSLGNIWDEDDFTSLSVSIGSFSFLQLLDVLETRSLGRVIAAQAIADAVQELYQTFVEDVIKKGTLSKRGYILPTERDYWFVLRPCELSYYKTASEKDKCGTITLQPGNRIESKSDFKFVLHTPERNIELGAHDQISQLQWHSALQRAIEYSCEKQSYQRLQAIRRRKKRQERLVEIQRSQDQLQMEKSARELAEQHAKDLQGVVREDSKRLIELELTKERLEKLLAEETQAKQDEEIVRGLQARLLQEEWDKLEELEALRAEQSTLLEEESKKRQEYEKLQQQNELQLEEAYAQLAILQAEREQMDEELKLAHTRTKIAEDRKEHLERRLLDFSKNVNKLPIDYVRRSFPALNRN